MNIQLIRNQILNLALGAAICYVPVAYSAEYPTKPIRLILGFAPGGQADILGRILGRKFNEILGQPVLIENRPGAGGAIAAELAAREQPDGYSLLMVDQSMMAANLTLYKRLNYNPQRDFEPISLIATQPNVLVVHPSVPAKTLSELVSLAKAKPGSLNFASGGQGSAAHLAGELFRTRADVNIAHVAYKGTGPALQDVVAGHVQMVFSASAPVSGHLKSGALRPLAVTSAKRSSALPNVPTIAEQGYPDFALETWNGLAAPAGTPKSIILTLSRATQRSLSDPAVVKSLSEMGAEVSGNSPEEFQTFIRSEIIKWGALVKASGTQLD